MSPFNINARDIFHAVNSEARKHITLCCLGIPKSQNLIQIVFSVSNLHYSFAVGIKRSVNHFEINVCY